jgi:hypothetical protein
MDLLQHEGRNLMATATRNRFREAVTGVEIAYPGHWYVQQKALPDYVYPQQILAASNYPIDMPPSRRDVWDPDANEENYPRVRNMAPDGIFLWLYAFTPPDGPTKYGPFRRPLDYGRAEQSTAPGDARWPNAVQRELGFVTGRHVFTLWVWEGLARSETALGEAREIVASLDVRP